MYVRRNVSLNKIISLLLLLFVSWQFFANFNCFNTHYLALVEHNLKNIIYAFSHNFYEFVLEHKIILIFFYLYSYLWFLNKNIFKKNLMSVNYSFLYHMVFVFIFYNYFIISLFLDSFLVIIFVLIPVAAYSLLDRKIIAIVQRRRGPNVLGFWGFLQFVIDALKLLCKEVVLPSRINIKLFLLGPVLNVALSLTAWAIIPVHPLLNFFYLPLDLLILLVLSSLNVYTVIISGWASNSQYAFLGSLRAVAQILSYELPMFFSLLPVILLTGSLSIKTIIFSQTLVFFFAPFLPSALVFFICIIAETNRAPFDLPEAESELVAGYNTEYSSLLFALFFISEYANMLLMSAIWLNLFWGGWLPFLTFLDFFPNNVNFSLKLCFLSFCLVFIRANLPRYRYDQFMSFGWKVLLPISFIFFLLCIALFIVLAKVK